MGYLVLQDTHFVETLYNKHIYLHSHFMTYAGRLDLNNLRTITPWINPIINPIKCPSGYHQQKVLTFSSTAD